MQDGGEIRTDCWSAHGKIFKENEATCLASETPRTPWKAGQVNHSVGFKSEDGVHTNHVEGVHSVFKRNARRQFATHGPKPEFDGAEQPKLDLVQFRANANLAKKTIDAGIFPSRR